MDKLHALLILHANAIAMTLGCWVALASFANRKLWPKPGASAPLWKRALHCLLIDWPAFLPSVNFQGLLGLPITIPFLSFSKVDAPPVDKQNGSISIEWMLAIAAAALFVLAVVGSGCGTAGAQALGKCELGAMPTQVEGVIAAVSAVLANTADINWTGDLESLGLKVGPSIVDCVVAAVTAGAQAQMPAHGQPTPMLLTVIQRGQIWAASHPAKCCAAKPVSSAVPMTGAPMPAWQRGSAADWIYVDSGDVAVSSSYPFFLSAGAK